jgi:hypothetical protein
MGRLIGCALDSVGVESQDSSLSAWPTLLRLYSSRYLLGLYLCVGHGVITDTLIPRSPFLLLDPPLMLRNDHFLSLCLLPGFLFLRLLLCPLIRNESIILRSLRLFVVALECSGYFRFLHIFAVDATLLRGVEKIFVLGGVVDRVCSACIANLVCATTPMCDCLRCHLGLLEFRRPLVKVWIKFLRFTFRHFACPW